MRRFGLACAVVLASMQLAQADYHLQWKVALPPRRAAWEHTPRVQRDTGYEVTHAGESVVVGCEFDGTLRAYNLTDGAERWRFATNGPIRYAAAVDGQRIVFGSEDGWLRCLDLEGKLLWQVRGGPRARIAIAHDRISSAWPISTRPVIKDGLVYFAAGYWPVDGIYIHAVELNTGKVRWTNDSAEFRPFGTPKFDGDNLRVDGYFSGGSFDLATGKTITDKAPAAKVEAPAVKKEEPPVLIGLEGGAAFRTTAGKYQVVTTAEGTIQCFAESKIQPKIQSLTRHEGTKTELKGTERMESLRAACKDRTGFALLIDVDDPNLVRRTLESPKLGVVVVLKDAAKADGWRRAFETQGFFDDRRLTVLTGEFDELNLPPYFATVVVTDAPKLSAAMMRCLRPYGGVGLTKTDTVRKDGRLPGADDWRQEFHDAANTLASRDKLIKAPLGVLWYGGDSADLRFYMDGNADHQSGDGINPQPVGAQVAEGRMILQGVGLLGAFDIYTGKKLWEAKLPGIFRFGGPGGGLGIHSKKYPQPWNYPEALAAEVPVTRRCRASGFNMVTLPGGIYVAADRKLICFDPETGKRLSEWDVPALTADSKKLDLCWGGLHASNDTLLATLFHPQMVIDVQAGYDGNGGSFASDRLPMAYLVAIDVQTGAMRWSRKAEWGFLNRAGVAASTDRVFALDLMNDNCLKKWLETDNPKSSAPPRVLCLDLKTGKELWKQDLEYRASGLVYSTARDYLLVGNKAQSVWKDGKWQAAGSLAKNLKAQGFLKALRGSDGSTVYSVTERKYPEPLVMIDDLLIDRDGFTFDLKTGGYHERVSPLTGEKEPWAFRNSGCNHLLASDYLCTWRCAFFDLEKSSGVMAFKGMDAGCTPTLIPADGLLNISNFGTHHKRHRMTSMALVHVPENPLWTQYDTLPVPSAPSATITHAGYNFGAPGDRVDDKGTLWLKVNSAKSSVVKVSPATVSFYNTPQVKSFVASTGLVGDGKTEVVIPLFAGKTAPKAAQAERVIVELTFLEPEDAKVGGRVFSVAIGGKEVLKDFDIVKEAGVRTPVTRRIETQASTQLTITLTPSAGQPTLAGVEVRKAK